MKLMTYEEARAALPGWELASVQALGFEAGTLRELSCDGAVGPRTLGGVYCVPDADEMAAGDTLSHMLGFVRDGRREGGVKNNHGPDVEYMFYGEVRNRTTPPGAWCAATVSRALLLAGEVRSFVFNSGARRLTDWFADRRAQVAISAIRARDIISWAIPRPTAAWGGHIGVVCHVADGKVYVVEGNGSARLGRVRVYVYDLPRLEYPGSERNFSVWRVVRPSLVR